jgi:hypothetical protein
VAKQKFSNATEDKDFYADKFIYDKEHDHYICPAGQVLLPANYRTCKGKTSGCNYRNYKACQACKLKVRCTKSVRGRTITRHIDQDLLDKVDQRTRENKELYLRRQMIVEHPFGTGVWSLYYARPRVGENRIRSSLSCLQFEKAINILGVKEIVRRLQEA